MTELRERFSRLDRIDVPDLTDEIEHRAKEPPPRPQGGRVAATVVALLVSAATFTFLTVAFRGEQPTPPGTEPGELEAIVEGVRVRWPSSWTLVQLSERSPDASRWPMFQLANFDLGVEAEALCPFAQQLPPDGVVLYVQRDLEPIAGSYRTWPVEIAPDDVGDTGCDREMTTAWRVEGHRFQASMAFGPEASEQDRTTMLQIFADLEVVDPASAGSGRKLDQDFRGTWYVVWGVRSDDPELAATYLVGDEPSRSPATRVLALSAGGGFGWSSFDPGPAFVSLGDSKRPDRSFVQAWGRASPEVHRVVLRARDGREIELSVGPSLIRYGLPARPTYVEFEPPLVGEYVALDMDGEVLGRAKERNWPPETAATSPIPSSPQPRGAEVWLPDAEAEAARAAIEAAVEGEVLMRGNNWNYPWVVYRSPDGTVTYRDAHSVSPFDGPNPALSGTRFSYPPDPEILYVGVAIDAVRSFGVERTDGSRITGRTAPVPGLHLVVVSVTVEHPRDGDRLVARDAEGTVRVDEPLNKGGGS